MKTLRRCMAVAAVLGLTLFTAGMASAAGDPHAVKLSVGYADTLHTVPGFHPHPWLFASQNRSDVEFVGTGSPWDAGALKIDNPSANPLTVDDVSVDFTFLGFTFVTYDLWGPYPRTVPKKSTLI